MTTGPQPAGRQPIGPQQPAQRQLPPQRAAGQPPSELIAYPVPIEQLQPMAEKMWARFADAPDVRYSVDLRTNQLLVMAPPEAHDQIDRMLRQVPPADGDVEGPDPYQLKHLSTENIEAILQQTWRDQIRVESSGDSRRVLLGEGREILRLEPKTGLVHYRAPAEASRLWAHLIETLDRPKRNGQEYTQVAHMTGVDPERLQHALDVLRVAANDMDRPGTAEIQAGPPVVHVPNATQLVTRIFQPLLDEEEEELPELDEPVTPADLAGVLGDVQLEFIPELGIVVIRGPRREVERVRAMIAEIERQAALTEPIIDVYLLQHINGQAAEILVQELYEGSFAPRLSPVSITSLDKPNALVLIGREEAVDSVIRLLEKLDQPVLPATELRVFPLRHMSAIDAEQTVRNFYTNLPGAAAPSEATLRPALGTRLRVIAEYRTNSLIVQAAPRDMEEVAFLLERLDVEVTEATHTLRIFQLRNALATDLALVLQEAISEPLLDQPVPAVGRTPPGVTQRSGNLSLVGVDVTEGRIIQSGILAEVTVTADPNVNALIVRGPAISMELMEELIRQLDRPPDIVSQIKVFTLENGDAAMMAITLQQLFLDPLVGVPGVGESALVPLRFAVDQRTNSIIVSGSAGDLITVETLILRLDETAVLPRETEIIRLRNAPALDVASAISQFLTIQREITATLILLGEVTPAEQIDREVIVVPELVTNSLIVSASPRYRDEVMELIRDLDFRPPMIMVQVVIAEVELNDFFEFGVELGLQDSILFDRGIPGVQSTPGFNFNNVGLPNESDFARSTLAGQSLSTFGLGRVSTETGYGGLVLSAASDSISILVRALQDAGRLQILSRPQIMTLDNEPAYVQVGSRTPRIVSSQVTQLGGVINTVADEDIGLLLRIQPRVNEDRIVMMTLDTERSEVGDPARGVPVAVTPDGQAVNSPPIDTTTAQTTIMARDGQTVVFAGLIRKERLVRARRIPYLSDVPVLGHLFRFDQETERRSELLVIMTPHVIDDDPRIDWMNYIESDRMSWCFADVVEMHTHVGTMSPGNGLWGPPQAPTIFPHLDPTGEFIPEIVPGYEFEFIEPFPGDFEVIPQPTPVDPRLQQTYGNSMGTAPGFDLHLQPPQPVNPDSQPPHAGGPQTSPYPPAQPPGPALGDQGWNRWPQQMPASSAAALRPDGPHPAVFRQGAEPTTPGTWPEPPHSQRRPQQPASSQGQELTGQAAPPVDQVNFETALPRDELRRLPQVEPR